MKQQVKSESISQVGKESSFSDKATTKHYNFSVFLKIAKSNILLGLDSETTDNFSILNKENMPTSWSESNKGSGDKLH